MNYKLIIDFKKDISYITDYYKKLIKRTKQKQIIGSINEWIVDNYYLISEQEKNIMNEYRDKKIKKISNKRKKQIYLLIYSYLKETDFKVDMPLLFDKLNNYQKKNNDYFSYIEIYLISILIRMILISELYKLSKKLNYKLGEKDKVDKVFNVISQKINNEHSFKLENYIQINENIIQRPYYIEQLNYKLKEMGQLSENIFIRLNELLLDNKISLKE